MFSYSVILDGKNIVSSLGMVVLLVFFQKYQAFWYSSLFGKKKARRKGGRREGERVLLSHKLITRKTSSTIMYVFSKHECAPYLYEALC